MLHCAAWRGSRLRSHCHSRARRSRSHRVTRRSRSASATTSRAARPQIEFVRHFSGTTANGTPVYIYAPRNAVDNPNLTGVVGADPQIDRNPADAHTPCATENGRRLPDLEHPDQRPWQRARRERHRPGHRAGRHRALRSDRARRPRRPEERRARAARVQHRATAPTTTATRRSTRSATSRRSSSTRTA